ncbi:hypothetical protein pb186bvf_019664 [Paramecium bursaria]
MKYIILLLIIVASKDVIDREKNKLMEDYIGLREQEAKDKVLIENLSDVYTIDYLHAGERVIRQQSKLKSTLRFIINHEGEVTGIQFD